MLSFSRMSKYKYPFYILFHPLDGFQELRFNDKASPLASFVILLLWYVSSGFQWQSTNFAFNNNWNQNFNLIAIAGTTVGLFLLAAVANWCFTTLLDGKATLKEIVITCSYGLIPIIAANFLATGLSWVLVLDEAAFISYMQTTATIWAGIIMLSALYIMHEFTFMKTLAIVALTVVGMLIIFFLLLLAYNLFLQTYTFLGTIYYEIVFKITS